MKKLHTKIKFIFLCLCLLSFASIGVFAKVGWTNDGWSGPNFLYKACNSRTTVFDTPQYSYMSATARIGAQEAREERYNPTPNTSVHAVANSGYNETCYSFGNAY